MSRTCNRCGWTTDHIEPFCLNCVPAPDPIHHDHFFEERDVIYGQEITHEQFRELNAGKLEPAPFALCEVTVQALIDMLPKPSNACVMSPSVEQGRQEVIHEMQAKFRAMLPDPRRKKIGNAIAAAMFGYGDKIPNEVFDKIVDAVMAVEP